jgi:solute carrier family 25 2-oxodicarboxylate transporter 21
MPPTNNADVTASGRSTTTNKDSTDNVEGIARTIAGALAGAAEALSVQPFDMVKTRHQLNQGINEDVIGSLRSLYREGGFGRFYRGMTAEVVGIIPKSSAMYATYDWTKQELNKLEGFGDTSSSAAIAGLISGIPEATIVTPTQVIKVRLQAKEHLGRYSNTIDCIVKTFRAEGIRGFTIGLGPTLWRNCVWNTVYFGTMHWLKKYMPETDGSKVTNMAQTLVVGFAGAVFATCFNAPFDVVKSRFQSQIQIPGQKLKYKYTIPSLLTIWQEEGIRACYKGFRPKAIRMGLGGAVAMATFELTMSFVR